MPFFSYEAMGRVLSRSGFTFDPPPSVGQSPTLRAAVAKAPHILPGEGVFLLAAIWERLGVANELLYELRLEALRARNERREETPEPFSPTAAMLEYAGHRFGPVGGPEAIGRLSARARKALRREGIESATDLSRHKRAEAASWKQVGTGTLEELDAFLAAHGLAWADAGGG